MALHEHGGGALAIRDLGLLVNAPTQVSPVPRLGFPVPATCATNPQLCRSSGAATVPTNASPLGPQRPLPHSDPATGYPSHYLQPFPPTPPIRMILNTQGRVLALHEHGGGALASRDLGLLVNAPTQVSPVPRLGGQFLLPAQRTRNCAAARAQQPCPPTHPHSAPNAPCRTPPPPPIPPRPLFYSPSLPLRPLE